MKKVTMYQTTGGELFITRSAANRRERMLELQAWWENSNTGNVGCWGEFYNWLEAHHQQVQRILDIIKEREGKK